MLYEQFPIDRPVKPALEAAVARQWRLTLQNIVNFKNHGEYNLAIHRWHFFALRSCYSHCGPLLICSTKHTPDQVNAAADALFEFQDAVDWEFFAYLDVEKDHQYEDKLQLPRKDMRRMFFGVAKLYNELMESRGESARVLFSEWATWHETAPHLDKVEKVTSGIASCHLVP